MKLPTWGGRSGKLWLFGMIGLAVFLLVSWLLGSWLDLTGLDLWILRTGLSVLGFVVLALVILFAGPAAPPDAAAEELENLLAAARSRLTAQRPRGGAAFGQLPLVLVLGRGGSAKTSIVLRSGLEPELLAGAVYQGDAVGPTPCINVWYAGGTLLVEAAGKLAADDRRFVRLVSRVRPRRLIPLLTGRVAAPRAALLCFNCEELIASGAAEAVPAAAKELRTLLVAYGKDLGAQLPVYVVFTKADRLRFFSEYVRSLGREEAQEVFGATLRWPETIGAGSYAEREYQRVDAALGRVLGGLRGKRLQVLAREGEEAGKAAAYEFPREYQKLRHLIAQFLVELCRPGQLDVAPVLRGFYFTGVRSVEGDAAPAQPLPVAAGERVAATQVFDPRQRSAIVPAPVALPGGGRRKPQWVFLDRLFRDVLLSDRAALAAARAGATTRVWRRAALAVAAVIFLLLDISVITSCTRARQLAARARSTAEELGPGRAWEPDLPPVDVVSQLDRVRGAVEGLSDYRAGLWGWASPDALYDEMRHVYFSRFSRMLLNPARTALLGSLQGTTDRGDYQETYAQLKAYLMTTTETQRLDSASLTPVVARWIDSRSDDSLRSDLIRRQFAFYGGKLCRGYAGCADTQNVAVVRRAREMLRGQAAPERVYESVVEQASLGYPAVQFNRAFPGTEAMVVARYEARAAFTPDGAKRVQRVLSSGDYQTAEWVLGEQARLNINRVQLEDSVRALYWAAYVREWRTLLDSATLVRFTSLSDAADRLKRLSDNASPQLLLFKLTSQNTAVESPLVRQAFQPVQRVVPASLENPTDSVKPYLAALLAMSAEAQLAAGAGGAQPTVPSTVGALTAIGAIVQGFRYDNDHAHAVGDRVRRLLEEPVMRVDRLVAGAPAARANSEGESLCRALAPLKSRYPLSANPNAPEASFAQVAEFFQPGGRLWQSYDAAWRSLMAPQGGRYSAVRGGPVEATTEFVEFFNRAAGFSAALWREGSPEAQLQFQLRLKPSADLPKITLNLDGRPYSFTQNVAGSQTVTWRGAEARSVTLSVEQRGRTGREARIREFPGPWGLFRLLQRATWRADGPVYVLQWREQIPGSPSLFTIEAEVRFFGPYPVLDTRWLSRMNCVRQVAR